MMGSGKSFWAQKISSKYKIDWMDLDAEIEKETMLSINEIFEIEGEDFFREKEMKALHNLAHRKNIIIATGGGTPCFHDNMQWMNEHGITVWIDEPIEILIERLRLEKNNRPLIKNLSDEEMKTFLAGKLKERTDIYSQSTYHLQGKNISKKSFEEIFNHV